MDIQTLVRPNIQSLIPYSTARDECKVNVGVFLDANENPYNNSYNRYPDPYQLELKQLLASIKQVSNTQIILGNGSDEVIDMIFRVFCEPAIDNIVTITPTYGMYKVCAQVNNIGYREVSLKVENKDEFCFSAASVLKQVDANSKAIFLCSPNNPTGALLDTDEVERLLQQFTGIVVIDEAYIDFALSSSYAIFLEKYPNLIVLQTLSKAWGAAGMRIGIGIANEEIIDLLLKVKYPYNINVITPLLAKEILENRATIQQQIKAIIEERELLTDALKSLKCIQHVYPSDANFLLIKVDNAKLVYDFLLQREIIVRDRSSVSGCDSCIRVSIGLPEENQKLIEALQEYDRQAAL